MKDPHCPFSNSSSWRESGHWDARHPCPVISQHQEIFRKCWDRRWRKWKRERGRKFCSLVDDGNQGNHDCCVCSVQAPTILVSGDKGCYLVEMEQTSLAWNVNLDSYGKKMVQAAFCMWPMPFFICGRSAEACTVFAYFRPRSAFCTHITHFHAILFPSSGP